MSGIALFITAAIVLTGVFAVSLYWAAVRGSAGRGQALALALAAPLLVATLYVNGLLRQMDYKAANAAPMVKAGLYALSKPPPPPPMAQMNEAIDRLAERLRDNPGDMDGWLMLARSCAAVGRYADAAAAYERAQTRIMNDSAQLVNWIGVRLMASNSKFDARTHELIEQAAAIAPDDPDVLLLRALAAHDRGDKAGRNALVDKLRQHYQPGSPERAELDEALKKMLPPDAMPEAAPDATPDATPDAPDKQPVVPKLPN